MFGNDQEVIIQSSGYNGSEYGRWYYSESIMV